MLDNPIKASFRVFANAVLFCGTSSVLGSGTVVNVHIDQPNHHNPTEAIANLVTKSEWSVSWNNIITTRCMARRRPPPT